MGHVGPPPVPRGSLTDHIDRLRVALAASYRLEEMVGAGGMASVYRALDLRHDRQVAVKVMHPELYAGVSADRFAGEVRLTATLQHPHILPLHDSGVFEDLRYYVMPFVEGGQTLRTLIERTGRLPLDDAVELALVVGSALDYAHRHGVIHRDIKPENVLLSDGVAIVADFGIARVTGDTSRDRLTGTGLSIGTPAYMSPEQAAGELTTDLRTDVYALGALLFEMLIGDPPFSGGSSSAIIKKLFTEPAPSISLLRADVPTGVVDAVARALEKSADDRYASVADFLAPLRSGRSSAGTTGEAVARATLAATAELEIPSVAVLPLVNIGKDPDFEYFCDGMTEELISTLARLPGVRVASRTSAFAFKGREATVGEIGKTLNVRFVLEGSVRHAKGQVRVTAQLVDVRTQLQRWGDRFDRALDDVFALQDELATTIADALSVRLSSSDGSAITGVRRGTENVDAYELVLRGRYFWNQRALDKAMVCFQDAVKLDPSYAQAWAGLADGFSFLGYYGVLAPHVAFERGRLAVARAVDGDPLLPESHAARGIFELLLGHDTELAGRSLRRAVELGPRLGGPRATLSQWLAWTGDRTASHAEAATALALEPLSSLVAATVSWAAVMSGEAKRAERFAKQGLELQADSLPCVWTLGGSLMEQGNHVGAVKYLGAAAAKSGRMPYLVAMHAHAAALAGDAATAKTALTEIVARPDGRRPGLLAWIHLGLGELDQAVPLLVEGLMDHDPHALQPLVMPVAGRAAAEDPRYQEAVDAAGFGELRLARARMLG